MIITITANLPDEYENILADQKNYPVKIPKVIHHESSTINVVWMDGEPLIQTIDAYDETIWIDNTESKKEWIAHIYEEMVIKDASMEFIKYDRLQNESERIAKEQLIESNVRASITSSVE